jgi:hypothetical protein
MFVPFKEMLKKLFPQFNDSHRKALLELLILIFLWGVFEQYCHLKNDGTLRDSPSVQIQEKSENWRD